MSVAVPHLWIVPRITALLAVCCLLIPFAASAQTQAMCPANPVPFSLSLPHLRRAVNQGMEGIVVALGSSSTQGAMASNLGHSYPAVLQDALSAALPGAHIAVINRGIGGQDAAEEYARLADDVLAIRPQAVVWQVGANGALRNIDPTVFRETVTKGVRELQSAGIDVILMDNQQSPRLLATGDEAVFDRELAQVAADTGASLFSRRALMRAWRGEGLEFADFIAADGLHHNDRGYLCVAKALAQSMLAGLKPVPQPMTAALSLPVHAAR